jgi:hypothetical protein
MLIPLADLVQLHTPEARHEAMKGTVEDSVTESLLAARQAYQVPEMGKRMKSGQKLGDAKSRRICGSCVSGFTKRACGWRWCSTRCSKGNRRSIDRTPGYEPRLMNSRIPSFIRLTSSLDRLNSGSVRGLIAVSTPCFDQFAFVSRLQVRVVFSDLANGVVVLGNGAIPNDWNAVLVDVVTQVGVLRGQVQPGAMAQ